MSISTDTHNGNGGAQFSPKSTGVRSAVRGELLRIAEDFDAAQRRMQQAGTHLDQDDLQAAEAAAQEASALFELSGLDLADLLLLLLRYGLRHRPQALRDLLVE